MNLPPNSADTICAFLKLISWKYCKITISFSIERCIKFLFSRQIQIFQVKQILFFYVYLHIQRDYKKYIFFILNTVCLRFGMCCIYYSVFDKFSMIRQIECIEIILDYQFFCIVIIQSEITTSSEYALMKSRRGKNTGLQQCYSEQEFY